MRKDAGYEVMDHILVEINGNEKIASIVERNREVIAGKVLAEQMTAGEGAAPDGAWSRKEWNVNGEKVTIGICKTDNE